jgi:cytoskeletal protein CcmA (bactofilin family)
MSRVSVRATVAALAIALVLAVPASANAMTLRQGQDITIGRSETIEDDVYAFGSTIQVDGTVDGDVVAAGGTIVIAGNVTGDVLAAGSTVRITGDVGGSVRASGGEVSVDGTVSGDVLASGGTLRLGSQSKVGRDAALAGGTVTMLGAVTRNADLGAGTVSVQGPVDGALRASASQITIGSGAKIGGDFEYWSDAKPVVQGSVAGKTVAHPAQSSGRTASAGQTLFNGFVSWVQGAVGWVLFGLLVLLLMPAAFARSADVLKAKPWPSLGIGFAAFILPLILAVPVFVVTVFTGGWWIVMFVMGVWAVLMAAGSITGALAIGRLVGARMSSPPADLLAMLLGLAIVLIVEIVPFLGGLIGFAVTLFGMGALVMVAYDAMRRQRVVPAAPEIALPDAGTPAAE